MIWAIATRVDPARDCHLVRRTPIDYLDFASPVAGLGSKLGIDATHKWPVETRRKWGRPLCNERMYSREPTRCGNCCKGSRLAQLIHVKAAPLTVRSNGCMHTLTAAVHATAPVLRQSSFSREELIACGEGELFGPNTPRLPIGPMRMVDRITHIAAEGGAYGRGEVRAELDIDPSLWFFACHFRGDPVMPGCLGLDAMWQLIGFHLAWSGHRGLGRALGVDEVRFAGQVLPNVKRVTYQIDIRRVIVRKLIMVTGDGSLAADGEPIYAARGLRVGLFDRAARMNGAALTSGTD